MLRIKTWLLQIGVKFRDFHIRNINKVKASSVEGYDIEVGILLICFYMWCFQLIYCVIIGLFLEPIVCVLAIILYLLGLFLFRLGKITIMSLLHLSCFITATGILACNLDSGMQVNPTYIFLASSSIFCIPKVGIWRGFLWTLYSVIISVSFILIGFNHDLSLNYRTLEQIQNLSVSNAITVPFLICSIISFFYWKKEDYMNQVIQNNIMLSKLKKEKEKLLRMLFHDLGRNTSLLSGYLELSADRKFTKEEKARLYRHVQEIKEVLKNARSLDTESIKEDKEKVSTLDLYSELKSLFIDELTRKNTKLIFEGKARLININVNHMRNHVLGNIISNAIKFSRESSNIMFLSGDNEIKIVNEIAYSIEEKGDGLGLEIVKDYCKKNNWSLVTNVTDGLFTVLIGI